MVNWDRVKKDYVVEGLSRKELTEKYQITRSCLGMRIKRDGWNEEREAYLRTLEKKAEQLDLVLGKANPYMDEEVRKIRSMEEVAEKLLAKISLAIDQLDIQLIREVRKEKELLYDHPQRADKATREIQTEGETLKEVKAPIDRNGIKLLAAALKDLKDIRMIRDPLDIKEQEAKIAKLQRESREEQKECKILVTFATDTEHCCE